MSKTKRSILECRSYNLPPNFPVLLLTGDRWHISDVKSGSLHFHNCLEIGICHTESAIMEFNGAPTPIRAGDMTCIPTKILHTTYSLPGMASLWSYIFLDPEELFREFIVHQELSSADLQDFPVLIINQEDRPDLYLLLTMIIEQLKQQKPNFRASVRGLLLALCIEFLRLKGSTQQHDLPIDPPENALVISPALNYIRDNYMNSFPIQTLVDLCHLSGTHFRRVFHEIMGISPLEYINVIRINKACMLMRTTESTILSVSEQVGFHSVSSFNRYFTKMIGLSPRDWRTRMLQTETKEMWQKQSILNFNGWR